MVKRIYNKVKSVLFADPNLLYEEERDLINKPFFFPGTNGKGVLLIHGWTSTPYEVRRLGKYLNENGYTVSGPLLRGHGTTPEDLENVRWQEWMADLEKAYGDLKKGCSEIFVGGTSIGSNLAINFAAQKNDVAGLILLATPYRVKLEKIVVPFAKIFKKFKKYSKKFYPPTFGVSTTITRLISYPYYPVASALETFDLVMKSREILGKITQPCLIMQSTHDHVVSRDSLEKIYGDIRSKIKIKKYVPQAYHTFISDIKNEHVFEDILEFINSL